MAPTSSLYWQVRSCRLLRRDQAMGREGLEMLSLGPSCFCSLPKMLPVYQTEQDDTLSPLFSQVETNNFKRMRERNNLKCRTEGQNIARVLAEGLGHSILHWLRVLGSLQAAPGYFWKTVPAQRLTVPIGTWICPGDAGQTVGRREGRPKALPVLFLRHWHDMEVGRAQCQGVCYPSRASHGRLGACT